MVQQYYAKLGNNDFRTYLGAKSHFARLDTATGIIDLDLTVTQNRFQYAYL
jgi:hypothetical protein